jgi:hypothetical protein
MAFTAVQVAHGFAAGAQVSLVLAFPGNVTAGDLLILWSGNGYTSLTDTQGNAWSAGPTGLCSTTDVGAASLICIAFAIAKTTGPCTVTISNPATEVWSCGIAEYNVNPPTQDTNSGNGFGSGFGVVPSPITTGVPKALVIAAAIGATAGGAADVWSVNSGFTIDDTMTSVPFNAGFCLASLNVPASGTLVNPTFTNAHWTFGTDATEADWAGPVNPTKLEISLLGVKRFRKEKEPECVEAPPETHVKRAM